VRPDACWKNRVNPKLDGTPLELEPHEPSRSLVIAPDGRRFVLGSEWHLRLFDAKGRDVWTWHVPGPVWAVNVTADGCFVVAAYNDSAIRWHRFTDGVEVLAFFPHADAKRWVAWTPEGPAATAGAPRCPPAISPGRALALPQLVRVAHRGAPGPWQLAPLDPETARLTPDPLSRSKRPD
jgi:hypothetical protein